MITEQCEGKTLSGWNESVTNREQPEVPIYLIWRDAKEKYK